MTITMITKSKNHGLCLRDTLLLGHSSTLWALHLLSRRVFQHLIQSPKPSQTSKAVMLPLRHLPPLQLLPFQVPARTPKHTNAHRQSRPVTPLIRWRRITQRLPSSDRFIVFNLVLAQCLRGHHFCLPLTQESLSNGIMWTSPKSKKIHFRTARDLINDL